MRIYGMHTEIIAEVNATDRVRLEAVVADRDSLQKHVWHAGTVLLSTDGCGDHAGECSRHRRDRRACVPEEPRSSNPSVGNTRLDGAVRTDPAHDGSMNQSVCREAATSFVVVGRIWRKELPRIGLHWRVSAILAGLIRLNVTSRCFWSDFQRKGRKWLSEQEAEHSAALL